MTGGVTCYPRPKPWLGLPLLSSPLTIRQAGAGIERAPALAGDSVWPRCLESAGLSMEILYRCHACKTEFRLDEREPCHCPKFGSMLAGLIQRFY